MKSKKTKNAKLSVEAERSLSPAARYLCRVRRFHDFYWMLVACMGAVCLLAVVVAVVANVLVGLCAAICVAVLYNQFKKNALRRTLRILCVSAPEGLAVSSLDANGEDVLFVPDRLMGLRVTVLGNAPFAANGNAAVTTLHLPDTLSAIGRDVLLGLDALEVICFAGSRDDWERIEKATDLTSVVIQYGVPYPDPNTVSLDASPSESEEEGDA